MIRITLNELNIPYVYLGLKMLEGKNYLSYKEFILEFKNEINKLIKKLPALTDFLGEIQIVKILGNEIKFGWKRKNRLNFSSILNAIEKQIKHSIR
ncbi:MAG: hypothetical protein C0172_03865 [Caldisphaera sp.]|jgi:hypothetical protein|nr:hypothetical protein [Caldisphaera sp.]PMP87870.1 MAG: hypothetical protein C0172_03865 [Caldisphaera sp.]